MRDLQCRPNKPLPYPPQPLTRLRVPTENCKQWKHFKCSKFSGICYKSYTRARKKNVFFWFRVPTHKLELLPVLAVWYDTFRKTTTSWRKCFTKQHKYYQQKYRQNILSHWNTLITSYMISAKSIISVNDVYVPSVHKQCYAS